MVPQPSLQVDFSVDCNWSANRTHNAKLAAKVHVESFLGQGKDLKLECRGSDEDQDICSESETMHQDSFVCKTEQKSINSTKNYFVLSVEDQHSIKS